MDSSEIRTRFLEFFEAHGHAVTPSSSLVPDNPSVLLTTAGMQQFKKYYTGELDPLADFKDVHGKPTRNTASIQKSFRTSDIDEVGDETHLTFFEMLGNFSFGGYWKKEAITYAHDFIVKEMKLPISYVTIFQGAQGVPKDEESKAIWNELGVRDVREEGMDDVFWGPTGTSGPCGPTTEIYCKNANGRDVEIWNIVFNEFLCNGSREELLTGTAKLTPLETRGIDTGMGFERLAMIAQKKKNIFETDLFEPLISSLPDTAVMELRTKRILSDHARAVTFLIADGVRPSNKGAGYVLRRLIHRIVTYIYLNNYLEKIGEVYSVAAQAGQAVQAKGVNASALLEEVHALYGEFYKELDMKVVSDVFFEEQDKFLKTLANGLKELGKLETVDAKSAFRIFESSGLPYEVIKDLGGEKTKHLTRAGFDEEFKKHQEISRGGAEKRFGGHGLILDTGELKAGNEEELKKVLRLHTATHLLQGALREVLGPEVHQLGSDITPERTRFDFPFPRKMTSEEIKKVEDVVNAKIKEDLPVSFKEMSKDEAEKVGALHFFKERYPEKVKVYYIGRDLASAWSKEFCGGPHVTHTGEIGHFKIAKEEAVGAGIRRVRGVVE
jgi:alanyl-tRNA synthetase